MQVAFSNFQLTNFSNTNLQQKLSPIRQLNAAINHKLQDTSALTATDLKELTALSAIFDITLNRACELVSKSYKN